MKQDKLITEKKFVQKIFGKKNTTAPVAAPVDAPVAAPPKEKFESFTVSGKADLDRAVKIGCFNQYKDWLVLNENYELPSMATDLAGTKRLAVTGENLKKEPINFYEDFTVENMTTKNKATWSCDALNVTKSGTDRNQKQMSADQYNWVNSYVEKHKEYTDVRPDPVELQDGDYEIIDLNKFVAQVDNVNKNLFPEPNKFYIYKKVASTNKTNAQQETIINDYRSAGWTDEEPSALKIGNYLTMDLSKMTPPLLYANGTPIFPKSFLMWKDKNDVNGLKYIQSLTASCNTNLVDKDNCRKSIEILHVSYTKNVEITPRTLLDACKNKAKACAARRIIPRAVKSKYAELVSLNNTKYTMSLQESVLKNKDMLNEIIKKSLVETKEKKQRILQESKIIKTRFKMILESGNYKSKKGIEDVYVSILSEMIYLHKQNFDSKLMSESAEHVFGVLGNLFDKPKSHIIDSFKEKGVEWILNKLGLEENTYLKNYLVTTLGNTSTADVPKLFTDCNFLTRKMAESVPEAYLRQLEYEKGMGTNFMDIVRNGLFDVIKTSDLTERLESNLSSIICPLVDRMSSKFSEKLNNMRSSLI